MTVNNLEIVNQLQQLVHEKFLLQYPTIFQSVINLPENSKLINAKKKKETLCRSLKWEQEKIDLILYEGSDNNNILLEIPIECDGKVLSPKKTQVLMLKNIEYKQTIYS